MSRSSLNSRKLPAPFALPWQLEWSLREAYERPARAYHHFGHVAELLAHYVQFQAQLASPVTVALAILFHDAIYVPGRKDNEAESARLAKQLIPEHLPALEVDLERVETLILLTARHGQIALDEVDADARLFLDCDMAILGSDEARYEAYAREIADEYRAVPAAEYRSGRTRFLTHLLGRDRIYLSEPFKKRFEKRARENLRRELNALAP